MKRSQSALFSRLSTHQQLCVFQRQHFHLKQKTIVVQIKKKKFVFTNQQSISDQPSQNPSFSKTKVRCVIKRGSGFLFVSGWSNEFLVKPKVYRIVLQVKPNRSLLICIVQFLHIVEGESKKSEQHIISLPTRLDYLITSLDYLSSSFLNG